MDFEQLKYDKSRNVTDLALGAFSLQDGKSQEELGSYNPATKNKLRKDMQLRVRGYGKTLRKYQTTKNSNTIAMKIIVTLQGVCRVGVIS